MSPDDRRSADAPLRIAAIGGDGIGPEVLQEGVRVLEALAAASDDGPRFEWVHFPWG